MQVPIAMKSRGLVAPEGQAPSLTFEGLDRVSEIPLPALPPLDIRLRLDKITTLR